VSLIDRLTFRLTGFVWSLEVLIRHMLGLRRLPPDYWIRRATFEIVLPVVVENVFRENPLWTHIKSKESPSS